MKTSMKLTLAGAGATALILLGMQLIPAKKAPEHARNMPEKELMLLLTNQARAEAGVPPVTMGTNPAPQRHAEQSLGQCAGGHWDRQGLKPYMRYSLAEGIHPNAENWFNTSSCGGRRLWTFISGPAELVHDAVRMWQQSSGHREALLDPEQTHLSIGIAWNSETFNAVQHFEKRRIETDAPPRLDNGILTMSGALRDSPPFGDQRDLAVIVTWDPPPRPLEENRIARTSCYGHGELAMAIRPPPQAGETYPEERREILRELSNCPDPQLMDPDLSFPHSVMDLHRMSEESTVAAGKYFVMETVEFQDALEWQALGQKFQVKADLSGLLERRGPGVYTLLAFHNHPTGLTQLVEHSFFHQVDVRK